MKVKFIRFLLNGLLLFSFLLISISCKKEETKDTNKNNVPKIITSTVAGGDWFNPNTWNEGIVPTSNSDVNIAGKVVLNDSAECLNLMIDASSQLIIEKNGVLKVKHHLVNEGIIVNSGELIVKK